MTPVRWCGKSQLRRLVSTLVTSFPLQNGRGRQRVKEVCHVASSFSQEPKSQSHQRRSKKTFGGFPSRRPDDPRALARYFRLDARADRSNLRLADAQRVIAREHGFASWLKLKQYVAAQTMRIDSQYSQAYASG